MARYLYGLTFGSIEERKKFNDKVYAKMNEQDMTVKDLADLVGYSNKSVYQFLSDTTIANKFLAAAIADKLSL